MTNTNSPTRQPGMYTLIVRFDVAPDFREQFIAAALKDGHDSTTLEPGTLRFELIEDAETPNRFYLAEGYTDETSFDVHATGQPFSTFFAAIEGRVDGPHILARGTRIVEPN